MYYTLSGSIVNTYGMHWNVLTFALCSVDNTLILVVTKYVKISLRQSLVVFVQ